MRARGSPGPRRAPKRRPYLVSLQRGPSAAAASSRALQGSRCSRDRPEAPSSPNELVTPGPPCSRGADGPIWVALMPPLRTARWFGPLGSLCSPTSAAPAAKGSASHAQCFPERGAARLRPWLRLLRPAPRPFGVVAGEALLAGAGTVNPGAQASWLRRQVHFAQ